MHLRLGVPWIPLRRELCRSRNIRLYEHSLVSGTESGTVTCGGVLAVASGGGRKRSRVFIGPGIHLGELSAYTEQGLMPTTES